MEKNVGIERVLQIMKYYKLSQRQFAMKTNNSPQTLNSMIVRNHELKLSTIVDILKGFPKINIEWLVLGEGEMLKPEKTEEEKMGEKFIPVLQRQIEHLEGEVKYLREQNMLLLTQGQPQKEKRAVG